MPLSRLEQTLADRIPPVVLILGDAHLLVNRAVTMVESYVLPRCGIPAFNHGSFRFSEPNALGALSVARTLPMMADFRLVVVSDHQEEEQTVL